jgi:SAM-dependent MidA family methyltransferase
VTRLGQEIAALIEAEGPMSVERYMALCLGHPRYGYYISRDPFGAAGDFTTAPEISQMFGELLGLWVAETWTALGRPAALSLVELGPGRGTLMSDALRALRLVPECRTALSVHLVETSPVLAAVQRRTLESAGVPVEWHTSLTTVPRGPAVILGNEFLDALPVRQFVRMPDGWHERLVGLAENGGLRFGLGDAPQPGFGEAGRPGNILEHAEAALAVTREIAERLMTDPGAALFLDYGHTQSGLGETLQAVKGHSFVDPLAEPGEADLTVHVDFAAIARAADASGLQVQGPTSQGAFLAALGIAARAESLVRKASPEAASTIAAALTRLTGSGPDAMGELFKVIGLSSPGLPALAGLPPASISEAQGQSRGHMLP